VTMGDILHGLFARKSRRKAAVEPLERRSEPESVGSAPAFVYANEEPLSEPTFDPGAHTVAEVLAFIEAHPETAEAVLAAEREGKARKSLLG
jgi:hypothetical protein